MQRKWNKLELATIAGLLVGTVGIAILWAAGVPFPFYPPPGIFILLSGAIFLAWGAHRWWWAPGVGAFLGLFVIVGFLIAGFVSGVAFENIAGGNGVGPATGQVVQMVGVVTAFVAGAAATAKNRARHQEL